MKNHDSSPGPGRKFRGQELKSALRENLKKRKAQTRKLAGPEYQNAASAEKIKLRQRVIPRSKKPGN